MTLNFQFKYQIIYYDEKLFEIMCRNKLQRIEIAFHKKIGYTDKQISTNDYIVKWINRVKSN